VLIYRVVENSGKFNFLILFLDCFFKKMSIWLALQFTAALSRLISEIVIESKKNPWEEYFSTICMRHPVCLRYFACVVCVCVSEGVSDNVIVIIF